MPARNALPATLDFPAFRPRTPWLGPDLQTVRNFLTGATASPVAAASERLHFEMPDGTGDRLTGMLSRPENAGIGKPLVVLIHGLTGCEESSYVLDSERHFLALGHPALRLSLRGASPTQPNCREFYHAGRDEDLAAVLDQLVDRPEAAAGLFLMGFSLGANMLLKFLAHHGRDFPVQAAVSVSAPIDLAAASERFLQPRNRLYHAWLLRRMKEDFGAAKGLDAREARTIRTARTIFEFDDRVVAPRNGFEGARDYYAKCSATRYLKDIRVPTLIIHALDDPWIPGKAYLETDWSTNPRLTPLLPLKGGHVGFHDAKGVWHNRMAELFLERRDNSGVSASAGSDMG